jgi:hypothetical protein
VLHGLLNDLLNGVDLWDLDDLFLDLLYRNVLDAFLDHNFLDVPRNHLMLYNLTVNDLLNGVDLWDLDDLFMNL